MRFRRRQKPRTAPRDVPGAIRQERRTRGLRLIACDEIPAGGDAVVARIAAVQRGVVSVAQLHAAGLDDSAIGHRVAGARLHRLLRGAYLVGHAEPAPLARETAALLVCGRDGVLSHATAARLHGWTEAADTVDVTTVGRRPRQRPSVRVHHAASLDPDDRRLHAGLPVTSPARTLVDLAAAAAEDELERALAEAIARRQVTRETVEAALGRATDRRGAGKLRSLLDDGADYLRSDGERALRALIRAAGLPRPRYNADVGRWNVDVLWPEERLVVELDGRDGHSSPWARDRDALKTLELEAAGCRVVRVTGRQLRHRPEWVLAQVAARLSPPAGRP